MSGADYQSNFTTLSQQGYQVSFISGYEVNGSIKYAAIWEKKSTNYIAKHGLTGAQFQTEFTTNTGNGFRLILLQVMLMETLLIMQQYLRRVLVHLIMLILD